MVPPGTPRGGAFVCTWDEEHGCWRTVSGDVHDAAEKRRADTHVFFASKKEDAALVQERRRADCERIDAEAQRLLRESALSAAQGFADCLTRAHWVRRA